MDIENTLLGYGKKYISLPDLAALLGVNEADAEIIYRLATGLIEQGLLEPVKSAGTNGNIKYPLQKKYRILAGGSAGAEGAADAVASEKLDRLHPALLKSGFLLSHPREYRKNEYVIDSLNRFLFSGRPGEAVSRKERSFEIFRREKLLDDSGVKTLLRKLQIKDADLGFYDTPEYCFHDYIPERKEKLTLLICENKDIWFNIRRCMFEDHYRSLFGVKIDGVVYGCGNKVSHKEGALVEYVRFMGNPNVSFLYWGDIDRAGFEIYRRAKEANASLSISLFLPGYRKMIERARELGDGAGMDRGRQTEGLPPGKAGSSFRDLTKEFSPEERAFLDSVFERDGLIPQEIIPYTLLSERD